LELLKKVQKGIRKVRDLSMRVLEYMNAQKDFIKMRTFGKKQK